MCVKGEVYSKVFGGCGCQQLVVQSAGVLDLGNWSTLELSGPKVICRDFSPC